MISGIHASIRVLRFRYLETWGRDWPGNDEYLRELTRETSSVNEVLILMREADAEPGARGEVSNRKPSDHQP